jgi:Uma2 family endonuclease
MTPEEYLARERQARFKSEFVDGRMLAMTGVTRLHGLIVSGLVREIDAYLLETPCEVFSSDMRVKISPSRDYVYPDVVVACDPQFEDGMLDTLANPIVIMEVLSDSTEKYDRGEKFTMYRRIETLREYVLLSQKRVLVEHYIREGDFWQHSIIDDPDASLVLASVGVSVPLRLIYHRTLRLEAWAQPQAET